MDSELSELSAGLSAAFVTPPQKLVEINSFNFEARARDDGLLFGLGPDT